MVGALLIAVVALVFFSMDEWRGEEVQQAAVLRAYAR